MCDYYEIEKLTWNHIVMYKLLVLDWNTWRYMTSCKLFIFDRNTWYHISYNLKKLLHKKCKNKCTMNLVPKHQRIK